MRRIKSRILILLLLASLLMSAPNALQGTKTVHSVANGQMNAFGTTSLSYSSQESNEIPIIEKPGNELLPRIYGSWVVYLDDSYDLFAYNLISHEDRKIASASVSAWELAEIYSGKVVWSDTRIDSEGDMYEYDLERGTEKIICSHSGSQSHPYIYENTVVWQDDRNGNWDIYMYDLVTGKETAISTASSTEMYPCVYGKNIVWWTKNAEDSFWGYHLTLYNIDKKQTTQLGNLVALSVPLDIYENQIVYQDFGRTSVSVHEDIFMFDLNTNTEIPICTQLGGQIRPRIFGNKIVWGDTRNSAGTDGIDRADVYMHDLSSKEEIRITSCSGTNRGGSPMPDIYMNNVVWSDDRSGSCDIYMSEPGHSASLFDPFRDSFSFENAGFGKWGLNENLMSFSEVAGFIANDPIYRSVDSACPGSMVVLIPLAYMYLTNYHEKLLNGHCYGMSYLVAHWFKNPSERPGYPDSTIQSLQLNDELHQTIDYAQQSQMLDFYTFVRMFFITEESISWSNLKEYQAIKEIVQTGTPTIMGIVDKSRNFYHAVVVYQIQSSGSTDTLYVSDPNKVTETYSFDTAKDDLGIGFRIMAAGINDQNLFDKFVEWIVDSLTLWAQCPVQLHVYDSLGKHVGVSDSGTIERQFEATFFNSSDSQLVLVPKPSNEYRVKLIGVDTGLYNLTICRLTSDNVSSTVKTGTIHKGQAVEYEVDTTGLVSEARTLGLFGISWLTWPIFSMLVAAGAVSVIAIVLAVTHKKSRKMLARTENGA